MLPEAVLFYSHNYGESINSTPVNSQECPALDNKLYSHFLNASCSKGSNNEVLALAHVTLIGIFI